MRERQRIDIAGSKALKFMYRGKLGRLFLFLFTSRFMTKLSGFYANSAFSKRKIASFINNNDIDMDDYKKAAASGFSSFNDFFTRKVDEGKRPLDADRDALISPADSRLSIYKIDETLRFTIKGDDFSFKDFLAGDEIAEAFTDGFLFIFRLCVDDYHRYIFIDDGRRRYSRHIRGRFHTVRHIALRDDYFKENEREYSVLATDRFKEMIQAEIGAMMVGKIVNHGVTSFKRGDEKGMFMFGASTVVLAFKKDTVKPDDEILKNTNEGYETRVRLGEKVGVAI